MRRTFSTTLLFLTFVCFTISGGFLHADLADFLEEKVDKEGREAHVYSSKTNAPNVKEEVGRQFRQEAQRYILSGVDYQVVHETTTAATPPLSRNTEPDGRVAHVTPNSMKVVEYREKNPGEFDVIESDFGRTVIIEERTALVPDLPKIQNEPHVDYIVNDEFCFQNPLPPSTRFEHSSGNHKISGGLCTSDEFYGKRGRPHVIDAPMKPPEYCPLNDKYLKKYRKYKKPEEFAEESTGFKEAALNPEEYLTYGNRKRLFSQYNFHQFGPYRKWLQTFPEYETFMLQLYEKLKENPKLASRLKHMQGFDNFYEWGPLYHVGVTSSKDVFGFHEYVEQQAHQIHQRNHQPCGHDSCKRSIERLHSQAAYAANYKLEHLAEGDVWPIKTTKQLCEAEILAELEEGFFDAADTSGQTDEENLLRHVGYESLAEAERLLRQGDFENYELQSRRLKAITSALKNPDEETLRQRDITSNMQQLGETYDYNVRAKLATTAGNAAQQQLYDEAHENLICARSILQGLNSPLHNAIHFAVIGPAILATIESALERDYAYGFATSDVARTLSGLAHNFQDTLGDFSEHYNHLVKMAHEGIINGGKLTLEGALDGAGRVSTTAVNLLGAVVFNPVGTIKDTFKGLARGGTNAFKALSKVSLLAYNDWDAFSTAGTAACTELAEQLANMPPGQIYKEGIALGTEMFICSMGTKVALAKLAPKAAMASNLIAALKAEMQTAKWIAKGKQKLQRLLSPFSSAFGETAGIRRVALAEAELATGEAKFLKQAVAQPHRSPGGGERGGKLARYARFAKGAGLTDKMIDDLLKHKHASRLGLSREILEEIAPFWESEHDILHVLLGKHRTIEDATKLMQQYKNSLDSNQFIRPGLINGCHTLEGLEIVAEECAIDLSRVAQVNRGNGILGFEFPENMGFIKHSKWEAACESTLLQPNTKVLIEGIKTIHKKGSTMVDITREALEVIENSNIELAKKVLIGKSTQGVVYKVRLTTNNSIKHVFPLWFQY